MFLSRYMYLPRSSNRIFFHCVFVPGKLQCPQTTVNLSSAFPSDPAGSPYDSDPNFGRKWLLFCESCVSPSSIQLFHSLMTSAIIKHLLCARQYPRCQQHRDKVDQRCVDSSVHKTLAIQAWGPDWIPWTYIIMLGVVTHLRPQCWGGEDSQFSKAC